MKINNTSANSKIKRRNFFVCLGASILGIFSISKLPGKIFISKVNSEVKGSSKIKVTAHPMAIKRESKGVVNG
jgi:hypothetical protein